jgi:hypothetical protein
MENLFIKETLNSPRVILDQSKKRFEISGKSFPENARSFYQPVFDWFRTMPASPGETIRLSLSFEYISSSSIIILKQLLSQIKTLIDKGAAIEILWHYDLTDNDIKDTGEEYEKVVGMKFQFIPKA